MTSTAPPSQRIASLFAKHPCWMIKPLAAEMHYAIPSVRRFLAEVGYYSSFTHNGGWYTLHSIPRFRRDGLWFYNDIGFSRTGTLTKTLVALIARSPAGMSAEMLGEKLLCRCHAVLVNLWRRGKVQRQKMGRCHIYFAIDPHIAAGQRQALTMQNPPQVQFSPRLQSWSWRSLSAAPAQASSNWPKRSLEASRSPSMQNKSKSFSIGMG